MRLPNGSYLKLTGAVQRDNQAKTGPAISEEDVKRLRLGGLRLLLVPPVDVDLTGRIAVK